ncbi:unnamed protein product [Urochloa humidicola]
MSHRRRLLNLVMGNKATGVCTLHHIDLHSGKNNLFYPSATAAAADPSFFSVAALETWADPRPGEPGRPPGLPCRGSVKKCFQPSLATQLKTSGSPT